MAGAVSSGRKRDLVTGFHVFMGASRNPAGEAALAIGAEIQSGQTRFDSGMDLNGVAEVWALRMPVRFGVAARMVAAAMRALRPQVVLSMGMAHDKFKIEHVAKDQDRVLTDR